MIEAPFQTLSAILGLPCGHFEFRRQCAVAGGELLHPQKAGIHYGNMVGTLLEYGGVVANPFSRETQLRLA